jgi:trimeric autotransporter adhesin
MRSFGPFPARYARHGLGAFLLAASMLTTGCEFLTGVPSVKRVEISLAPSSSLPVGGTGQANGTAIGDKNNAITSSKVKVAYSSSNPAVASVNQTSGAVVAISEGTADIIASSRGKSAKATLTVTPAIPVRVDFTPNPLVIEVGKTVKLDVRPQDAQGRVLTNRSISIASAAPGIVTASGTRTDNVQATGVSLGITSLNGSVDGTPFSLAVSVINPQASSLDVALQKGGTKLLVGESTQLLLTFKDAAGNPLSATGRVINYSLTDQTVASVNQATGVVTGLKVGTTQITVTEQGTGVRKTFDLTVEVVPVKFLTFANPNPVFRKGAPRSAEALALDSANNRLNRTVAYTSSNPAVLSVNPTSGIATPVDTGTATITATLDNLTTRLNARVTLLPIGQVTVAPLAAQVYPGQTVQYTATVIDSLNNFVTDRKPTWTSSATNVATINPTTGLASATGPGQTTISAVMDRVPGEGVPSGGQVVLTVNLTPVDSITVSSASVTVARGATVPVTIITRDAAGTQLFGRNVNATSQDAGIAIVSQVTGNTVVIQGINNGTTTIILQALNSAGIAEGKRSIITVTVTGP